MSANRLTMPSSTMNLTALFLGSSTRAACLASFIIVVVRGDMGHGARRDDRISATTRQSALCYHADLMLADRTSSAPSLFVEARQCFFERRVGCQYEGCDGRYIVKMRMRQM